MQYKPFAGEAFPVWANRCAAAVFHWLGGTIRAMRWFLLPWVTLALLCLLFPVCRIRYGSLLSTEVRPLLPHFLRAQFEGEGVEERIWVCDPLWERQQLARLASQPPGQEDAESRRFLSHAIAHIYVGGHPEWPREEWEKVLNQPRPEQALLNAWEVSRHVLHYVSNPGGEPILDDPSTRISAQKIEFLRRCAGRARRADPENGFPLMMQLGVDLLAENGAAYRGLILWLAQAGGQNRGGALAGSSGPPLANYVEPRIQKRLIARLDEAVSRPRMDNYVPVILRNIHQEALLGMAPEVWSALFFWGDGEYPSYLDNSWFNVAWETLVRQSRPPSPLVQGLKKHPTPPEGLYFSFHVPTISVGSLGTSIPLVGTDVQWASVILRLLFMCCVFWMLSGWLVLRVAPAGYGMLATGSTAVLWILLAAGTDLQTLTRPKSGAEFSLGHFQWDTLVVSLTATPGLAWIWVLKRETALRERHVAAAGSGKFLWLRWLALSPEAAVLLGLIATVLAVIFVYQVWGTAIIEALPVLGSLRDRALLNPLMSWMPSGPRGRTGVFINLYLELAGMLGAVWLVRLRFGYRDARKHLAHGTLRLWRNSLGVAAILLSWALCLTIAAAVPLEWALDQYFLSGM